MLQRPEDDETDLLIAVNHAVRLSSFLSDISDKLTNLQLLLNKCILMVVKLNSFCLNR